MKLNLLRKYIYIFTKISFVVQTLHFILKGLIVLMFIPLPSANNVVFNGNIYFIYIGSRIVQLYLFVTILSIFSLIIMFYTTNKENKISRIYSIILIIPQIIYLLFYIVLYVYENIINVLEGNIVVIDNMNLFIEYFKFASSAIICLMLTLLVAIFKNLFFNNSL